MDYSFDVPDYSVSFDYSVPNMSVGSGGYSTPDVQMSVGTPDTTYAGGQYFSGETGSWGGAGYSPEAYYSALSAQYGSGLAQTSMTEQVGAPDTMAVTTFQHPEALYAPSDAASAPASTQNVYGDVSEWPGLASMQQVTRDLGAPATGKPTCRPQRWHH